MKNVRSLASAFAITLFLASCSMTGPIAISSNPVGPKTGQATGTCFLGGLCFGADASITTAAKNGGITKIATVDQKRTNILGLVQTYTTIVTGE